MIVTALLFDFESLPNFNNTYWERANKNMDKKKAF